MQKRMDTHSFVEALTGTHRYVLAFLTDEVLLQPPTRLFLPLKRQGRIAQYKKVEH
jgi:ATP/maltotriose-dependent transcriptional regulator MalT